MNIDKRLSVVFFPTLSGAEPVREWLKGPSVEDRHNLGRDLRLVEIGWPTGMPLCRPLGGGHGKFEEVSNGNRIARVLFCAAGGHMDLLHGFVEKTQKIPPSELQIAIKRQTEINS